MTSDSLGELGERLRAIARVPTLVVACDYDGTVAPLVDDPMSARANRDSAAAMRSLAELGNTHVAVISGRSLRDLATLSRFPEEIRLVGSHGGEFDLGFASQLSDELVERRRSDLEGARLAGSVPVPGRAQVRHARREGTRARCVLFVDGGSAAPTLLRPCGDVAARAGR